MASLKDRTVVILGGSSGIGFGIAVACLREGASVTIASSNEKKVNDAVLRLKSQHPDGNIVGKVLDISKGEEVKKFFQETGGIDHLVITTGDKLRIGFPNVDLNDWKNGFDIRFWGPAYAAQSVKINTGGSITLTLGSVVAKPQPGWTITSGIQCSIDGLTRGLAVDLAPIRVNAVSPGVVKTELWDFLSPEERQNRWDGAANKLLLKHVADPSEVAEAYLFLMKCTFITGQRIEVDGGVRFI